MKIRSISSSLLLLTYTTSCAQDVENNNILHNPIDDLRPDHLECGRPNVLFISIDDLRPDLLACYGNKFVKSPNIDAFASEGVMFQNAYCQTPLSMPSRASVMTGYRPENINNTFVVTNHVPGNTVTLPQFFKNNGYKTISVGKIYHYNNDDPQGWDKRYTHTFYEGKWCDGYCSGYTLPENKETVANYLTGKAMQGAQASSIMEIVEKDDSVTPDFQTAKYAIKELQKFKESEEPFFLAVGFYRPHMPLTAPKKYWDMYPRESIQLPENFNQPACGSRSDWDEVRRYGDTPLKGPMPEEKAKDIIRGYRASVSFVDAQVGRVLDELKRLKMDQNTIVVIWSDNGWRLGEHGLWSKPDGTECPTQIMMMFKAPGYKAKGRNRSVAELVDIYPTLAELCGLEAPYYLDGESLVRFLKNASFDPKQCAFSNYGTEWYTVRTSRYRLIEHKDGSKELYDYENDPQENTNLAKDKNYISIVEQLHKQLAEKYNLK